MNTEAEEPLRYKPKAAAALLQIDVMHLYVLIREGVFTPIRPHGKGRGKRLYLDPAEVRAYAAGGAEAVKALRAPPARRAKP